MHLKNVLFAIVTLLVVLWLYSARDTPSLFREDRVVFETVVSVKFFGGELGSAKLTNMAFDSFVLVDSLMSSYRSKSEISRISNNLGDWVNCSTETIEVLQRAKYWAQVTNGAYDPTIGCLTKAWEFQDKKRVPDDSKIDSLVSCVDFKGLELKSQKARVNNDGMQIDLGGAAKGYAVDHAIRRLQAAGVKNGLIEAGGDIRYWGRKPDGTSWRIAVQHPRKSDSFVEVEDIGLEAIATSGDYQQYFIKGGQRYHHILDPQTGWPSTPTISTTIWTRTAMDADILATAVFVLGEEKGIQLAESLSDVEALVFTGTPEGYRVKSTKGLRGRFRIVD